VLSTRLALCDLLDRAGFLRPRNLYGDAAPPIRERRRKGRRTIRIASEREERVQREERSWAENRRSVDNIDYPRARAGRGDVKGSPRRAGLMGRGIKSGWRR